jgi:hypothetical protein
MLAAAFLAITAATERGRPQRRARSSHYRRQVTAEQ